MRFRSMLKSDIYKFFHTPVWIWHLVIPLVGAGVFVWYDSFNTMKEMDQVSLYIETLSVVFPIVIGIIMAMVSQVEEKAAGYQLLLTVPKLKSLPHLSKLLVLLTSGLIATLIAVGGFGLGFRGLGSTLLGFMFFIKLAIILFVSMLPLYLIHYLVSFILGNGDSVGLGIVGGLLSALLLTGLGDKIWYFLPWGLASRFSMNFFIVSLSNGQSLQSLGIKQGIMALILMLVILVVLSGIMFKRWEGGKSEL